MANRHKAFKKGGMVGPANKFKHNYTAPGSNDIEKEGKSKKEKFATGGGVSLARAHGGAAKGRADRKARGGATAYKKGGSVWSKAASGLRGKDAFAGKPHLPKGKHGAHGMATGGAVPKNKGGKCAPEEGEGDEEEDPGYKRGGVGKMHPAGGHHRGKH